MYSRDYNNDENPLYFLQYHFSINLVVSVMTRVIQYISTEIEVFTASAVLSQMYLWALENVI